jgi:predicted enzyme related to lactoylglutathione lyase
MSTSIRATSFAVALDCPDAASLAEFYAELLGWRIEFQVDAPEWVDVLPPEGESVGFSIGCQQIEHYRAPDWPEGPIPQQEHLDFYVQNIEEAAMHAIACGAIRHEVQPSESGSFIVFLDPVGHPFCLCQG